MTGVPNKMKRPKCCLLSLLTILTKLLEIIGKERIQKTFEQLLYETDWKMRTERYTEGMISCIWVSFTLR